MPGSQTAWFRRGAKAERALSQSARTLLASWPIEEHAKCEILQTARRRGRRSTQWTQRPRTHDRGDLWAIVWLLAPFCLVLPLYATNVNWIPFTPANANVVDGFLETTPGILAIALGFLLARWWVRIIRPNWLRYAAAELDHPVCLSCTHWNAQLHVGDNCLKCGHQLVNPADTTTAAELPENLRTIVSSWPIDLRTRTRLTRRYAVARRTRNLTGGPRGHRLPKTWLLMVNAFVLVCFGLMLFFGNKLETLTWLPSSLRSWLDGYGAAITIMLLLIFFGGLWLSERRIRFSDRCALAAAASRLELPVCPECLAWNPDAPGTCPGCPAPEAADSD